MVAIKIKEKNILFLMSIKRVKLKIIDMLENIALLKIIKVLLTV